MMNFAGRVFAVALGNGWKLWGITLGFVRNMVLSLDESFRTCVYRDWVFVNFDFPHCVFGYVYKLAILYLKNPNFKLMFYAYHGSLVIVPVVGFLALRSKI